MLGWRWILWPFPISKAKLIKTCNYCDTCVNFILHDHIVLGIRDTNTQQAIPKERKLSLEMTIDICHAAENATAHYKDLTSDPDTVNKLQTHWRNPQMKSYPKAERKSNPEKQYKICKYCRKSHPMVRSRCSCYDWTCTNRQERNHYAVKCPWKSRRVHRLYDQQSQDNSETSNNDGVDALTTVNSRKDVKCRMFMHDDSEVIFELDTGSSVNVVPERYHPPNLPLYPCFPRIKGKSEHYARTKTFWKAPSTTVSTPLNL